MQATTPHAWRPLVKGPGNHDPEVWILGAILDIANPRALDDVREAGAILEPSDFSDRSRQVCWQTMLALADEGVAPVYTAVWPRLRADGNHQACTSDHLHGWWEQAFTSAPVIQWARLVKQAATARSVLSTASKAGTEGHPIESAFVAIEARIAAFEGTRENRGTSAREAVDDLARELETGRTASLVTGLGPLDERMGPFRPGELIIVGARTSTGKTAFALSVFDHVAETCEQPGLFLSLEMPRSQILMRLVTMRTGLSFKRAMEGRLSNDEANQLDEELAYLARSRRIFIDDSPGLSIRDAHAIAKRHQRAHGLRFLVVDYLQLMRSPERQESREREVAEVSAGLKRIAMELEIPVLALAQLNRKAEYQDGKKPTLANLRDSGSIEQDADRVLLLWRPEGGMNPEEAWALIAKNRNGECGNVELRYWRERMKWCQSNAHGTAPGMGYEEAPWID